MELLFKICFGIKSILGLLNKSQYEFIVSKSLSDGYKMQNEVGTGLGLESTGKSSTIRGKL